MALLEETNCCCICPTKVHRRVGIIPAYYCAACFEAHKDDILASAAWVHYLENAEKQRRKRRNRRLQSGVIVGAVYVTSGTFG